MVQRKVPDVACSKTEPRKGQSRQEKRHNSQEQDVRSNLQRRLRTARSIKRISELEDLEAHLGLQQLQSSKPGVAPSDHSKKHQPPNYMKPTTSSDARKEQSQVIINDHEANHKKIDPKLSKKPSEILPRKPTTPTMKKYPAVLLFPDVSSSKATCSSTLKDTRFPKELELAPGSTEAEGTSTMKVCPFTYCSLNGHCHPPLPPLRSFIAAKRRLLKTQKNIRLKRLTSSRRRCSRKVEKSPPVEDLSDDFFVEIYADRGEESAESAVFDLSNYGDEDDDEEEEEEEDCDDMDSEIFSELLLGYNDQTAAGEEAFTGSLDESYSEISCGDDVDQKGEFSASELEVLAEFLEFLENQEHHSETPKGKNCELEDGGYLSMDSSDIGEELSDSEAYNALLEAIDADQGLEYSDDDDLELEFLEEMCGDDFQDQNSEESVAESPYRNDDMDEIFFSLVLMGLEEDSLGTTCDREFESLSESGRDSDAEIKAKVVDELQEDPNLPEDAFSSTEEHNNNVLDTSEEVATNTEIHEENASLEEIEFLERLCSESIQELEEEQEGASELPEMKEDPNLPEDALSSTEAAELEVGVHDENPSSKEIEFLEPMRSESTPEVEEGVGEVTEVKEDPDLPEDGISSAKTEIGVRAQEQHEEGWKLRLNIMRKSTAEDPEEELKAFNPRSPNFLPVEPDPEAEKIDLRHQLIDERKSAEDWMIDHALQEVVNKLTPARKKKVALIVEAIETIAPSQTNQPPSPLKNGDMDFARARSMQACS